jgi:aryl-alcohol dehydrogenase-like predicted oxidoreductase
MLYRKLGKTGLEVSEVGLGTSKGLVEKLSRTDGEKLVARAIDLGVNFIDSARHYGRGEAEARVGAAIKGRRDDVFLCTKAGTLPRGGGRNFSRKSILASMDESLRMLGTDRVDVYLLHMAGPAQLRKGSEAVETLLELRDAGKTRFIGASVDDEMMWKALEAGSLDALEITYNVADLYPEDGFLEAAEKEGMGLMIKEPLAVANFLRSEPHPPWAAYQWERLQYYDFLREESDMTAAEIALRFVLNEPRIHTAIQATSNMEHLEANISLSDGEGLSEDMCRKVRECYRRAVEKVG